MLQIFPAKEMACNFLCVVAVGRPCIPFVELGHVSRVRFGRTLVSLEAVRHLIVIPQRNDNYSSLYNPHRFVLAGYLCKPTRFETKGTHVAA